jgi:hypothetical protein
LHKRWAIVSFSYSFADFSRYRTCEQVTGGLGVSVAKSKFTIRIWERQGFVVEMDEITHHTYVISRTHSETDFLELLTRWGESVSRNSFH